MSVLCTYIILKIIWNCPHFFCGFALFLFNFITRWLLQYSIQRTLRLVRKTQHGGEHHWGCWFLWRCVLGHSPSLGWRDSFSYRMLQRNHPCIYSSSFPTHFWACWTLVFKRENSIQHKDFLFVCLEDYSVHCIDCDNLCWISSIIQVFRVSIISVRSVYTCPRSDIHSSLVVPHSSS